MVLSWDKISDRHTASSNQAQIVSEDPFSIAPLRNATTLSFAGGAAAGKGLCATYWKNTMQGRWILGIKGGGLPQILTDTLTLFKSGGADSTHKMTI